MVFMRSGANTDYTENTASDFIRGFFFFFRDCAELKINRSLCRYLDGAKLKNIFFNFFDVIMKIKLNCFALMLVYTLKVIC